MAAQDPNTTKDQTGFSQYPIPQENIDVPFTPQAQPAPTTPPLEVLQKASQSFPPSPQQSPKPESNLTAQQPSPVISKNRSWLKKLLVIVGFMIFGATLILIILKFLLPKLSELGVPTPFAGKVELTWWGLWEDESIVKPIIDEYQASHSNVKINYLPQSKTDYRERLVNSILQGGGPDIFRFHNTWVPMLKNNLATLPGTVMSQQEFSQTFYPVAVTNLTTAEGIVGIPLEYDGLALFVNDEIFATYGKLVPKTWDELRDTAVALTIKDENDIIQQAGVAIGQTKNVDHWQEILALMMLQNKVDLGNPTGDLAEGAINYFTSLSKTYGVWDDTLPNSTIYFASGKLAMYFGPSWRVFEIWQQNPALKFKVVPVPQLPKDDPAEPDITYATYWAEGVNKNSKNTTEAWEFLKYLSTKETLEKLYQQASKSSPNRRFGEPYPRQDMRDLLLPDPIVGGFIALAPYSKSWYLASRTYDGASGINTRMSDYYEDAINSILTGFGGSSTTTALQTLSSGTQQVLVDYGLMAAPPPVEKK